MEKSQVLRTSYSALDTFKQCPQKYKFQAIDKIRVPKSKEAVFGNKIHEALKFFHSKYPVSPTLDELLNYYKDNWNSEPYQSQEEDMIYFGEGIRILKNYYNHYLKIRDKFTVIDAEARFEVLLENPQHKDQKCLLTGIIDRIDKTANGIELIDYKTTKRLLSQQEIDNNLQLSLYCLGLINRWPQFAQEGLGNIKLKFCYLRHQEIVSTTRTKEQLDSIREQIWKKLAEIEKSDFKPIPSSLCDWCGYKKICPMWKNLYKEKISINDEQVKKIIDEFFALKEINGKNNKRLNELKELIEEYLNQEKIERVFSENGYITRLTQTRSIYNMDKIKKALGPLDEWQTEKKYTVLKASAKKRLDKSF